MIAQISVVIDTTRSPGLTSLASRTLPDVSPSTWNVAYTTSSSGYVVGVTYTLPADGSCLPVGTHIFHLDLQATLPGGVYVTVTQVLHGS